jgi:hypothetical protein
MCAKFPIAPYFTSFSYRHVSFFNLHSNSPARSLLVPACGVLAAHELLKRADNSNNNLRRSIMKKYFVTILYIAAIFLNFSTTQSAHADAMASAFSEAKLTLTSISNDTNSADTIFSDLLIEAVSDVFAFDVLTEGDGTGSIITTFSTSTTPIPFGVGDTFTVTSEVEGMTFADGAVDSFQLMDLSVDIENMSLTDTFTLNFLLEGTVSSVVSATSPDSDSAVASASVGFLVSNDIEEEFMAETDNFLGPLSEDISFSKTFSLTLSAMDAGGVFVAIDTDTVAESLPIPIPAPLIMMACGVLAVCGLRRRS